MTGFPVKNAFRSWTLYSFCWKFLSSRDASSVLLCRSSRGRGWYEEACGGRSVSWWGTCCRERNSCSDVCRNDEREGGCGTSLFFSLTKSAKFTPSLPVVLFSLSFFSSTTTIMMMHGRVSFNHIRGKTSSFRRRDVIEEFVQIAVVSWVACVLWERVFARDW